MSHLIAIESPLRELAHRTSDGIDVTLLWNSADDSVYVEIYDGATEEIFEIGIAPEDALDAFHHPFAYASRRAASFPAPVLEAA